MSYAAFLAKKESRAQRVGIEVDPRELHAKLHDFQRAGVVWAAKAGRSALFWDCGLGKTFAQLEWARVSGDTVLLVAPLSVARQTVREARLIDLEVNYVRDGAFVTGPGLWITNYEMIERFDPSVFDAIVLDESSILKSYSGARRQEITDFMRKICK